MISGIGDAFEANKARLYGYAVSLTGNRHDAEDLLQECAVRVLSARAAPDHPGAIRAWLFRIIRNVWIDQHRHSRRMAIVELDESNAEDGIPYSCDRHLIDTIAVKQALERLPVVHREVIALVDLSGFSYREVGEILGIPIGTVMSRVSRARGALLVEIGAASRGPCPDAGGR